VVRQEYKPGPAAAATYSGFVGDHAKAHCEWEVVVKVQLKPATVSRCTGTSRRAHLGARLLERCILSTRENPPPLGSVVPVVADAGMRDHQDGVVWGAIQRPQLPQGLVVPVVSTLRQDWQEGGDQWLADRTGVML
jgi:hypothetical protein